MPDLLSWFLKVETVMLCDSLVSWEAEMSTVIKKAGHRFLASA